MDQPERSSPDSRFTAVEVLAIGLVAAIVLVIGGVLAVQQKRKAQRISCIGRLKNIGLSFRIYATDHQEQFPSAMFLTNAAALEAFNIATYFSYLSNEIVTPIILRCPADKERAPAQSFANITAQNISYFAGLSATEAHPESALSGDRNIIINGQRANGLTALSTNAVVEWDKSIHREQGNMVLGDGSIQKLSSARLGEVVKNLPSATNWLYFP